ncbi:MAG: ThiF family adenylyltransferase [Clostridia bacterium]|nr:ThiF family adenylyltransferase [Clostridia bacterium]
MLDYSALKEKTILVVGCGGLGGYVINGLARAGVKKLIIMDGDVFSVSNMNRQLLSGNKTIGRNKAEVYAEFIKENLGIDIECHSEFFGETNASVIDDCDLVMDCLDSVKDRLLLSSECSKRGKIMIHGAIDEEQGQLMICRPEDKNIGRLFRNSTDFEGHKTVCFAVETIAALQVSLASKVLSGNADEYFGKIVVVDLESTSVLILNM